MLCSALLLGCNHAGKPQANLSSREQRLLAKQQFLKDSAKQLPPPGASQLATTSNFPEDDRDVVVKLQYNGFQDGAHGRLLKFFMQAYWLVDAQTDNSKSTNFSLPANGRGEGKLDLGIWRLRVLPKVVSSTRGKYDIELQNPKGSRVAQFSLTDSGKQAALTGTGKGYSKELVAYYAESRMTGYQFFRAGSRQPQYGVALIGKGWNYVENSKKQDLSKGYLFPQFALVIVGPEWLKDHQFRRDMIDAIKVTGGYGSGGAMFY